MLLPKKYYRAYIIIQVSRKVTVACLDWYQGAREPLASDWI